MRRENCRMIRSQSSTAAAMPKITIVDGSGVVGTGGIVGSTIGGVGFSPGGTYSIVVITVSFSVTKMGDEKFCQFGSGNVPQSVESRSPLIRLPLIGLMVQLGVDSFSHCETMKVLIIASSGNVSG